MTDDIKTKTEEKIEKKKVVEAIDQWLAMNHQNQIYKLAGLACVGVVCILFFVVLFQSLKAPLVIVDDGERKTPYFAATKKFNIDEEQLQRFVTEYLYLYNKWEKLDPNAIIKQVAPFSTEGMAEKLRNFLTDRRNKGLKDKEVSQDIAHLRVKITDKAIIATYDKVIHINSVPFVMPTEVSLQVTAGTQTRWNPLGLYVNGILEHEGSGQ